MRGSETKQWKMDTLIGPIYLTATVDGLSGVLWKQNPNIPLSDSLRTKDPATLHLVHAQRELSEYFSGERKVFSVPLDIAGTEFQKSVWAELQKIPFGKTYSYRDIAQNLECKAFRAVGTANGRNPVSIIIPCHRVINSSGKLGGYAGGLSIKEQLLKLESR